ncbi:MAG: ATP-binding protein [Balneolaceae bacterium]|nr:ATP-binding protein [Balneolaceae bacterium]
MTELTEHIKNGIYLNCNKEGRITDVLFDDLDLVEKEKLPLPFADIVSKESLGKASDFWEDIRNRDIVFDYELYIKTGNEPIPLKFTAAWFRNKIWVIGAIRNEMMEKMLDEMMLINNEQQNLIRQSEKKLSDLEKQGKRPPIDAYEEISQVNNELINAQRKLIKQNEEILRLNNELKETNQELEQFAYSLSHDLKEPLRMIRSFMSLLEKNYGPELDERAKEYIHYAADGAERMNGYISDLLEYSRIGRKNTTVEKISIRNVLDKVIRLHASLIDESNADVETGEMPTINCQRVRIEQLFNNLLGNALKYRKPNVDPVIKIEAREEDDAWLFSVSDNGKGIPENLHSEIFNLFSRGEPDNTSGSGMGLAICKKIVEQHDGKIWVESEEGKGSTFFFTIGK